MTLANAPSLAEQVHALQGKYTVLIRLREKRESLEKAGVLRLHGDAANERRRQLRALAQQFPGSLRELELAPSSVMRQRLAELAEELAEAGEHPRRRVPHRPWVRAVLEYHEALRHGLAARRDGRYVRAATGARRLSGAVLHELAERHGCTPEAMRRLLFGV